MLIYKLLKDMRIFWKNISAFCCKIQCKRFYNFLNFCQKKQIQAKCQSIRKINIKLRKKCKSENDPLIWPDLSVCIVTIKATINNKSKFSRLMSIVLSGLATAKHKLMFEFLSWQLLLDSSFTAHRSNQLDLYRPSYKYLNCCIIFEHFNLF